MVGRFGSGNNQRHCERNVAIQNSRQFFKRRNGKAGKGEAVKKVNFETLTDYYIGLIGIKPNDFWRQTWRENGLIAEHYHNNINLQWEQTRYLAAMIHNVQCQKKSQMLKPEQLFQLPVDKKRQVERAKPKSTREQMEAFELKAKQMNNKKALK